MNNQIAYDITAKYNCMQELIQFESELRNIKNVGNRIDFDMYGLLDNINYCIICIDYNIKIDDQYYENIKQFINDILETAKNNNLKRTEDKIEDYGSSFYIVFDCDKWINK